MKRALVLLLLVAGCTGGGDREQSAKEVYLEAAERICADANRELAAAKKERPAGIDGVAPYVHRLVEIARSNVRSLEELSPPPEDAADLAAKVLDPLRVQLAEAEAYDAKVAAAAKANEQGRLFQLLTSPPTQTKVDLDFMRSYGFKNCVTAADTAGAGR